MEFHFYQLNFQHWILTTSYCSFQIILSFMLDFILIKQEFIALHLGSMYVGFWLGYLLVTKLMKAY